MRGGQFVFVFAGYGSAHGIEPSSLYLDVYFWNDAADFRNVGVAMRVGTPYITLRHSTYTIPCIIETCESSADLGRERKGIFNSLRQTEAEFGGGPPRSRSEM